MKYKTVLPVNLIYDTSVLNDFVLERSKHYCVIEYSDKDIKEVSRLMREAVSDPQERAFYDEKMKIEAYDENGKGYLLNVDSKEPIADSISIKKFKKIVKKSDKSGNKIRTKINKLLNGTDETYIKKIFTLSSFKRYLFVSKEHNIAFFYRIKKSKNMNQPILIYFHGGGCCGMSSILPYSEYIHYGPVVRSKKHDSTVIIPQFPYTLHRKRTDFNNYIDAVKQLSEILCKEYSCDKDRIYIFGISFGGFTTWSSAYRYPEHYACAMPVMGGLFVPGESVDYEKLKDMPLWVAHSSDDTGVSVDLDDIAVSELKKVSDKIIYSRWDEYGHKMAPIFLKNEKWDEWMFDQSLGKR